MAKGHNSQYDIDFGFYKSTQQYTTVYYELDGGFRGGCTDCERMWLYDVTVD